MRMEGDLQEEVSAARFRDDFFLHSIASQNPKLYQELYAEPDVPEEWEVPRSPEDLQRMLAELAQVGVDLHGSPDVRYEGPSQKDLEHQYDVRPATQPWNS